MNIYVPNITFELGLYVEKKGDFYYNALHMAQKAFAHITIITCRMVVRL